MPSPKVLALILAGGEGGRLDVLTQERAKPAMPFAGVYRLIDFALSNCTHSGISDVWVLQQYQPHALTEHLANGRPWDLDRTSGGLRVLQPYLGRSESGWYKGNADAIYRNKTEIERFDPDLLLVLSADHVYRLDYGDVVATHLEREAAATLVTTRVPIDDASRFGTVEVDDAGRVTEFAYKPEHPAGDLVTTEVFVYDARVLLQTLEDLAPEDIDEENDSSLSDFGDELLPRLVRDGQTHEHRLEGYWRDVGTVESYWDAHMQLLEHEPPIRLDDPEWPILTRATHRPPAWIASSARVEGSLVSPGCIVRGRVERSVLAPGTVVEEGAEVVATVVLDDVLVERGARVERAVVDAGATIRADAAIGDRDGIALIGGRGG